MPDQKDQQQKQQQSILLTIEHPLQQIPSGTVEFVLSMAHKAKVVGKMRKHFENNFNFLKNILPLI